MVAKVADSLPFKHKYTSGVIAFHPDDKPTPEQINAVLRDYERLAFAGLDPSQYAFSAIQHVESDGSTHVHTFAARCELSTGKSFNPAPPGSLQAFDTVRDFHNENHRWKSPDDPMLARGTKLGSANLPRVKREAKKHIDAALTSQVQSGFVKNRGDVIEQLEQAGFEIARETKSSISIKDPSGGQNIRLTGALYERDFNSVAANVRASEKANERSRGAGAQRVESARTRYQEIYKKRAEYNRSRYTKPRESVEPQENIASDNVRHKRNDINHTDFGNHPVDVSIVEQNASELHRGRERPALDSVRDDIHRPAQPETVLPNQIESNYDRIRTTIKLCVATSASRLSAAVQNLRAAIECAGRGDNFTRRRLKQQQQKHQHAHSHQGVPARRQSVQHVR